MKLYHCHCSAQGFLPGCKFNPKLLHMYAASEGTHSIPNSALDGNETVRTQLSGSKLINVAPYPIFAGFNGAHEGMMALAEVTGCMHVLR